MLMSLMGDEARRLRDSGVPPAEIQARLGVTKQALTVLAGAATAGQGQVPSPSCRAAPCRLVGQRHRT